MTPTAIFRHFRQIRMEIMLLSGMVGLYFFSYFQRVAVPGTIFNELQVDFKTSAGAITALSAIFLYVYGTLQVFTGVLADRFGGMRMLLTGGTLMTMGAISFPLARSIPLLYATRILLAVGASFMFLSLVKEIDTLFDRRHFAMWLSVTLFFGYTGGLVGTLPLERAVHWFGWRLSLVGIGLLCAVVLLANFLLYKKIQRPQILQISSGRFYLKDVFCNPRSWLIILPSGVTFSIYFLFQASIGKKMLTDVCGIGSAQAASITFAMLLVCMIGTSLTGFIPRLIGERRKPILIGATTLMLGATTFMLWMLSIEAGAPWLMMGYVMLAMASAISPITCSLIKEVNPEEAAATSVGAVNCLCYLCVAAATNLAGIVMDAFHAQALVTPTAILYPVNAYRVILTGCLIAATASWISSLCVSETRGQCTYRRRPFFD